MEALFGVWEWYVAGPLLGLFVPLLLLAGNKQFGVSTTLEHICYTMLPGGKRVLSEYSEPDNRWRVFFGVGLIIGAVIAAYLLSEPQRMFLPMHYHSLSGLVTLFAGGLLIGFGTRYAKGCTAGHSIFGLSVLNVDSLKATLAFFAGGLIFTFINTLF